MFDEDEEHGWKFEEAEKLGEHELFLGRKTLRKFWERKGSCETEREVIWWRVEREISSAKVGVAFSNRDDEKNALHALSLARGVRPRVSTINAGKVSDMLFI